MCYLIFFILLLVTTILLYMMRNFNHWKELGVKFLQPLPVFGNVLDVVLMKRNIGEFSKYVYDRTSEPFIGFYLFDQPALMIRDLDMIKCVLIKDFEVFMDRSVANNVQYDTIGSNLLFLLRSPKWNAIRRKLNSVFSPKKMKAMSEQMDTFSKEMVEYISKQENKVLEVKTLFAQFAVDTITSIAYGLKSNCFIDENSPFNSLCSEVFNWSDTWQAMKLNCFFLVPKLVKLFRMKFVDTRTSDFFRQLFWNTVSQREKTKISRNDFIDLLMKYRNPHSSDDVQYLDGDLLVAQALNFFAGGFETTSSTMTYALLELARNTEIQNKLRGEIQRAENKDGSLSYDDIQTIDYLEKVILETLRKYPVVPFLDRQCSKTYKLPNSSLTLKEGTIVYISVLGLHYDEKFFPEPDRFDPARFNKENFGNRHSMTYLPFGDGPRACFGKRFALLSVAYGLAHILLNFEVRIPDKTVQKDPWSHKGVTLQPECKTYVEFIKLQI